MHSLQHPEPKPRLFARGSWPETSRITDILRKETVGGMLLLVATVAALAWANSPWSAAYFDLADVRVGTDALGLHLDLTLATWAADGLLAIFFFIVGLELKREFVAGDLRDPARAALPVVAAIGGMAVPAVIFVAFTARAGDGAVQGWAIPTATDIAFAVAVLAVISTHLPAALRTFLLTLAVVDDLLAITVIAVFYSDTINGSALALALLPLAAFAICVQRGIRAWWILLPLAVLTWAFVHESGVHATVAGVLLGFTVPVLHRISDDSAKPGLAEQFEHRIRPLSAGFAVPVFAFFAAGVAIGGLDGLRDALGDPIALGIVFGLVIGKVVGIVGTSALLATFTRASLDADVRWIDVVGVAMLAGIGFTVSLLIGDLAYESGTERDELVKIGVLAGSLISASAAAVLLRLRNRHYRAVAREESRDDDHDGIPDVYQREQ
ncbi:MULTISPECIES: Na+/H+ antiporter NhaA [Gordonia]|jgi:NhaA family Na+:H+ antiporter|uniref:Na(+)/H(+) antiporter NhaA n=2 Tax=Gordonia alkanivorans TaxID=84096 RepID=F9VXV7_9ACTN|nr:MULTISPECIES: Na+/H+ antiporter NhaA [Gordonia]AZZ81983.1 Na+/H+ antiporter NhaA [Gordonia alkanivorans]ETA07830.1 sodium:proton antiporter [Gordonia alkanivorans CGMCC 6845]MDH3006411.1 Na+/H+ antiporter NhaA [Gordonia alkanivorans]MDH3014170.1 Na+/H+ antiporter NhaA [Gordonia alkanivorans]MDH3018724.1 Na+/H+ antiporter NhaA [Gordonia alkanivorans]